MRRAGTVVSVAQGVLVVRAADSDPAGIGAPVVDDRWTRIGRIVDIFGPVGSPYLVVSMDDDVVSTDVLGEVLYIRD